MKRKKKSASKRLPRISNEHFNFGRLLFAFALEHIGSLPKGERAHALEVICAVFQVAWEQRNKLKFPKPKRGLR